MNDRILFDLEHRLSNDSMNTMSKLRSMRRTLVLHSKNINMNENLYSIRSSKLKKLEKDKLLMRQIVMAKHDSIRNPLGYSALIMTPEVHDNIQFELNFQRSFLDFYRESYVFELISQYHAGKIKTCNKDDLFKFTSSPYRINTDLQNLELSKVKVDRFIFKYFDN